MCMGGGGAPRAQKPIEPMKNADAEMAAAGDSTARAQALRKGLMSTFTRYTGAAGTPEGAPMPGAMAGKADKLGG